VGMNVLLACESIGISGSLGSLRQMRSPMCARRARAGASPKRLGQS
jgi:hypothetical protein